MVKQICPIWRTKAEVVEGDWVQVNSSFAGGKFLLSKEVYDDLIEASQLDSKLNAVKISTHILKQNIKNIAPKLTYEQLEKFSQEPVLNVTERFNLLLKTIKWQYPDIGKNFSLESNIAFYVAIGSTDIIKLDKGPLASMPDDPMLRTFYYEAIDQGYMSFSGNSLASSDTVHLTLNGHRYIESLGRQLSDSDQIFVAMWFNENTVELYNKAIEPAIEEAGYKPMRIDDKPHNEKICDEIIAEIRKSKALIADMTCGLAKPEDWSDNELVGAPRGGVFYEAGFAQGLGKPVIWTVHKKLAEIENVSHFDVRQYHQIRWNENELEEAKKDIRNRIEATLGQGPHVKN